MWQLDNVGISNVDCADSAVATFEKSVEFDPVIGKYIACLPWKNSDKKLPSNRELALSRLSSILKSLRRDNEKLHQYNNIFKEQLECNFIEKVDTTVDDCTYKKGALYSTSRCG